MDQIHLDAVIQVNMLYRNLVILSRSAITAMRDGKIDPLEAMALSMSAMQIASAIMTMVKGSSKEEQAALLYVLENASVVLTE